MKNWALSWHAIIFHSFLPHGRTWWLMTAYFLVGAWLSWRDVRGEAPDGALLALSSRLAFWMVAAFHILGTVRDWSARREGGQSRRMRWGAAGQV